MTTTTKKTNKKLEGFLSSETKKGSLKNQLFFNRELVFRSDFGGNIWGTGSDEYSDKPLCVKEVKEYLSLGGGKVESGVCEAFYDSIKEIIGATPIESGEYSKKVIFEALKNAAIEETRFVFNGVFFGEHIAGTDGRRLFRSNPIGLAGNYIIPHSAIKKIKDFDGENVSINFFSDKFEILGTIGGRGVFICGNYIAGNFPDYQQVVPKNPISYVDFDSKEAREFLKSALKFAEKPACQVIFEGNKISFKNESGEVVEKEFEKAVCPPVKMAFKSDYLLELPKIAFWTSKHGGSEANGCTSLSNDLGIYLVMPMKG